MIVGAGVVGTTAAAAFSAAGAHVTVLDVDLRRLQQLQANTGVQVATMLSTPYNLAKVCTFADVLVGAVLRPGEKKSPLVGHARDGEEHEIPFGDHQGHRHRQRRMRRDEPADDES